MQHYYIKEIKAADGQLLYTVTKNPYGKRDWRHTFESRREAEHRCQQLNVCRPSYSSIE